VSILGSAPASRTRAPAEGETASRRHLLAWVPLAIMALLPWFLLLGRGYQVSDPDTFWHIRAGDFLRSTGQFSGPEPWSPFSSNPWVLHEWLPELAFSVANERAGLPGVAWVWYAMTLGVAVALYLSCRSQGPAVLAALATVLGLLGMWASLSPRPQMATFAFAAVATATWLTSSKDGRRRWWLVPLTGVWACSHGMWFVSPMLGVATVIGLSFQPSRRRDARRLTPVALSCLVIGAVTPVGPQLLTAPLSVSGYTWFVSEWDPPRLASPPVLATLLLLVATAVTWARSGRRTEPAAILLWLIAVAWTLMYTRTVAVGAAVAAPIFVSALSDRIGFGVRRLPHGSRKAVIWTLASTVVASSLMALLLLPASTATAGMPTGLDAALNRLPAGTVVFNEYGFGGWLRYAHPNVVPVIDERTEVFSQSYIERYLTARGSSTKWTEFARETGSTAALVPEDSAVAAALDRSGTWRVAGSDAGLVLYERAG
jgi:hypothetical protein